MSAPLRHPRWDDAPTEGARLVERGEYAQAVRACLVRLAPHAGDARLHHDLARALYGLGEVEAARAQLEMATRRTDAVHPWLGLATLAPAVPSLSRASVRDIRLEVAARLAAWTGTSPPGDPPRPGVPGRGPLRVGYLSAHLHRANYMKPVAGLLNRHDRNAVSVHLFVDHPAPPEGGGYVRHGADVVTHVHEMDCARLAHDIREARIDVLVELDGYGSPTRLPLLLRRSAPVTVSWFNMYATAGLPGVDAVVGDAVVSPASEDEDYAERVIRLPLGYLTFTVRHPAPAVTDPPSTAGGALTFGCLAPLYKITPHVLDAWTDILHRAPGARLLLANRALASAANRAHLGRELVGRGIDSGRFILRGPSPHAAFLGNYADVDVALDTFPYSGGTTTMEALWQGVPVLTFRGDRWVARTTESLLRHAGLATWVAEDRKAWVERAVELARNPATPRRLRTLRHEMRQALQRSRACDVEGLARSMEARYRELTDSLRPR